MTNKVLIIDDEKEIGELLQTFLENDGIDSEIFINGQSGLEYLKNNQDIDLAILDIMLPDIDGLEILRQIRQKFFFPVLMLTAKDEDMSKITGLTLGADDYITKPFNPLEVIARVKTQIRRAQQYNNTQVSYDNNEFEHNGLKLSNLSHKCFLYDEEINLTPIEFKIIWYLAKRQGKVVSSEDLFKDVWQEKYFENSNNTVMAHITRLREKLHEEPRHPKFIKTVWGVGYTIEK